MREFTDKATAKFKETKEALKTVYAALNKGQQSKLIKDEKVKALLLFYEVSDEEGTLLG